MNRKPPTELTRNRKENLLKIQEAILEYNRNKRFKTSRIVFEYDAVSERYHLTELSVEADKVVDKLPLTTDTLRACLMSVGCWKYSIRNPRTGFWEGRAGIQDYWLETALRAKPHDMPKIGRIVKQEDVNPERCLSYSEVFSTCL